MLMCMVPIWSGTPRIHFSCPSGILAFTIDGVASPWLTRARLGNVEYLVILAVRLHAPGLNGMCPELAALLSCCLHIIEDMICIDKKHAHLIVEKDKPLACVKSVHHSCSHYHIDDIAWSSNPFVTRTLNATTAVRASTQD
jgi:hypothetical protein